MVDRSTISVVIAVRNGETYLGEALASVLAQTRPADEVLVIDDGSTDRTRAVALGFGERIRVVTQGGGGPAAARNRGIAEARGELLAFLDHDDVWEPDKLRLQEAVLVAEPDVDLVFGHCRPFRSPELAPEVAARLACDDRAQPSTLISCLLARRSAFERVGMLRPVSVDFVDWMLRAQEAGLRVHMLDDLVTHRRIHTDNLSLRDPAVRRDYLKVLKASLDRRRAQRGDGAGSRP